MSPVPRPVAEILDWLAERRIHVVVSAGQFAFRKHPHVSQYAFEKDVASIRADVEARRDELIDFVTGKSDGSWAPKPGSRVWEALPPDARRRYLVRRLHWLAARSPAPANVWWFSIYTRTVRRLAPDEAPPVTASRVFLRVMRPGRWVSVALGGRPSDGFDTVWEPGVCWEEAYSFELPHTQTPPHWKEPRAFPHPRDWRPGPGFKPYVPTKKERAAKWRAMWRTEVTYRDTGRVD